MYCIDCAETWKYVLKQFSAFHKKRLSPSREISANYNVNWTIFQMMSKMSKLLNLRPYVHTFGTFEIGKIWRIVFIIQIYLYIYTLCRNELCKILLVRLAVLDKEPTILAGLLNSEWSIRVTSNDLMPFSALWMSFQSF